MLGPMFALLLLTSPAAGPVDQQSCWLLCSSPTPAPSGVTLPSGRDWSVFPEPPRNTLPSGRDNSVFPSNPPAYVPSLQPAGTGSTAGCTYC